MLDTLTEKDFQEEFPKMEETVGPVSYMREGTTSRVTAADRPYGEFYDFLQRQSGKFWINLRM